MGTDNSENLVAEILEIQHQEVQEVNVQNRKIGRLGLSGHRLATFSDVCGPEATAKYVQDAKDSEDRINARRHLLAARKQLGY